MQVKYQKNVHTGISYSNYKNQRDNDFCRKQENITLPMQKQLQELQ